MVPATGAAAQPPLAQVDTSKVFLAATFKVSVSMGVSWRQQNGISVEAVWLAGHKATAYLEKDRSTPTGSCSRCFRGHQSVVQLGLQDFSSFGPHTYPDAPGLETFIFDRCRSHCNSSRLHLGGSIVLKLDFRRSDGTLVGSAWTGAILLCSKPPPSRLLRESREDPMHTSPPPLSQSPVPIWAAASSASSASSSSSSGGSISNSNTPSELRETPPEHTHDRSGARQESVAPQVQHGHSHHNSVPSGECTLCGASMTREQVQQAIEETAQLRGMFAAIQQQGNYFAVVQQQQQQQFQHDVDAMCRALAEEQKQNKQLQQMFHRYKIQNAKDKEGASEAAAALAKAEQMAEEQRSSSSGGSGGEETNRGWFLDQSVERDDM